MKRRVLFVVIGILAAGSMSCQTAAPGLTDEDKAAIRQLDDTFIKAAMAAKPDWDTILAAYYAEDAKSMWPNVPAADGRAAIKAALSQNPPYKEFALTEVSLEGAGGLAYRHFTYVVTMAVPGASGPAVDKGKVLEVFKKQADGTWRVIRDVGNSDLPVPGLTIPTGSMAADASPEVKKLGDVVGGWKYELSVAGGPWTTTGEGTYTKAQ